MGLLAGTKWDRPPHCERCDKPETECTCPPPEPEPPEPIDYTKQTAVLAIEKRKKGKKVTVIRGLVKTGDELPELLTKLKTVCGAGGKLEESTLEIQGEHLPKLRETLKKIGYKVKG